jgi:predicted nuclease of predicted toxin-antitoxin system
VRFLVDMNLSAGVAAALRAAGHEAVHLRELGLEALDDLGIFARAAAERRVVVTFDLDFADILAASSGRSVSVILLRLRAMTTANVVRRLPDVLRRTAADLESGAIVIVEEARLRIRRLPIGSEE